jgi:hypothetical protein
LFIAGADPEAPVTPTVLKSIAVPVFETGEGSLSPPVVGL